MPRITGVNAPIQNTRIQYERNGKCGTTEVVTDAGSYLRVAGDPFGWKMVFVEDTTLDGTTLVIENMSTADQNTLCGHSFKIGDEIMGKISAFTVTAGTVIVYKEGIFRKI